MNDIDVKKLKREELLEMLIESEKKAEALEGIIAEQKAQITELEYKLSRRSIDLEEAGNIAEASMRLNGMFEAAQASIDQYVDNVRKKYADIEQIVKQREEESQKKTEELLSKTQQTCKGLLSEAAAESTKMRSDAESYSRNLITEAVKNAEKLKEVTTKWCDEQKASVKKESDQYWNEVSKKLEDFYEQHKGLAEMMSLLNMKLPSVKGTEE